MSMVKYVPKNGGRHFFGGYVIPPEGLVLPDPVDVLDRYGGVTKIENVPESDWADNPSELPEGSLYVLDEVKAGFAYLSSKIPSLASKAELQAVWKSAEINFAPKSLADFVTTLANKLGEYAKSSDLINAVSYLSSQVDHVKTYTADVTISPAEMLALNATPKTLVPAPGAGKMIELKRVEFFLDFEASPYTVAGGNDLSLEYSGGGQILQVETTGWLDQSSDQRRCAHHGDQHAVGVNESVALKMLSGEISVGDSPLKCRVDYRIVDVLV